MLGASDISFLRALNVLPIDEIGPSKIMKGLLSLPNEILFNIVGHVKDYDPRDIESLALCCKETLSRMRQQLDYSSTIQKPLLEGRRRLEV